MRTFQMTALWKTGALALLAAAGAAVRSANGQTLIVTASNATTNQLLVYNSGGQLIQTLPTHGAGGVSGNSGGVSLWHENLAVVNFGSSSISLFKRTGGGFEFTQTVTAASSPVSVAFGNAHLYILGTTKVESHQMLGDSANSNPDGVVTLLKADGSAAQVGVLPGQIIVTEKSNAIETVNLLPGGALTGSATLVSNIPSNVNAPFGLVTRGNDAYVTIAHANELSLVRNESVLTVVGSGGQMAPCWLALDGPFLFAANTASSTVSRFAVYGRKIVLDSAVAASVTGAPTDIAHAAGLVALIHGQGPAASRLSIFSVDEDGNLTLKTVTPIGSPANGAVISAEY